MTGIPRQGAGSEVGAGTVYTLLAATGFAAVSTLTSLAIAEKLSLPVVLMWRYSLASVAMVTFVVLRGYPRMPWREAMRFIVIGGGGQALFVGLALSSLRYVSNATLAFLFYTYPAWVTIVQAVRGAEQLTRRRVLALAMSFAGIAVIVLAPVVAASTKSIGVSLTLPAWQGLALALSAAVAYGIYIPTMQTLQKHHPVPVTSAYAKLGSAVCFLFLAIADRSITASLTPAAWTAIAALALVSTVLPSVFFLMGLMRLGAVRTAIISTVEPFLTAVLSAIVLRQAITMPVLAGGALIIGAVLVLRAQRTRVA